MSTYKQQQSHGHMGNELLYPMAKEGDEASIAILKDRGNVVTTEGKLRKSRTRQYRDGFGIVHELTEIVENGKLIERTIDGVAITGNVVPFH